MGKQKRTVRMYPQHNRWTCGPYALAYAMSAYGIFAKTKEIEHRTHCRRQAGTTEKGLRTGAKYFGFFLDLSLEGTEKGARDLITRNLKHSRPSILSVDGKHWITVLGFKNGKFLIADSGGPPVRHHVTWKYLYERMMKDETHCWILPLYKLTK